MGRRHGGCTARGPLRTLPGMQGTVSGVLLVAVFAAVLVAAVFLAARLLRATSGEGSDGASDA
jgi:hypothetical protein